MQLGRRIRFLREMRSISQRQLAKKAGISVSYVSMIELGDRTPHVETLVSLANALGIPVSEVVLDVSGLRGGDVLDLFLYLRTRSLTPADVEALLLTAKVMLDGGS